MKLFLAGWTIVFLPVVRTEKHGMFAAVIPISKTGIQEMGRLDTIP
jgi:hypothetical protein